jgi:hypothetical protein
VRADVATGPTLILDGAACVELRTPLEGLVAELGSVPGRGEALSAILAGVRRVADAQLAVERVERVERATARDFVPVAVAARTDGVSERAIRAQVERGTRAAERRGRRWYVAP